MKTIEEAANTYSKKWADYEQDQSAKEGFIEGVEFAQKMIPIIEEKPTYYTPVIVEYEQYHAIAWLAW